MPHFERHRTHRIGWLRAAVLGANDGIVSTASLVLGVVAAGASSKSIVIAGVAGLVAGAMSMAAGEYVSVSSQADTERADLDREQKELAAHPKQEHGEMTEIYVGRGLDAELASNVATQLMKHDALGAHGRDELGISLNCPFGAGIYAHVDRFRQLARVPRAIRLSGRTPRRRFCNDGCCAGDLLGCLGHGRDCWGWSLVWGSGLRSLSRLT
jgi:VIT family